MVQKHIITGMVSFISPRLLGTAGEEELFASVLDSLRERIRSRKSNAWTLLLEFSDIWPAQMDKRLVDAIEMDFVHNLTHITHVNRSKRITGIRVEKIVHLYETRYLAGLHHLI